jgi:hypothetical protein
MATRKKKMVDEEIKSELNVTRQVEIILVYTTYSDGSMGISSKSSETITKVEAAGILSLALNDLNKESYPI